MGRQPLVVAIHPDSSGPHNSSSPLWARLIEEAGHVVREVNVLRADILDQLQGADGFMWRWGHFPAQSQVARRLLPVIERDLGLAVYPDQRTCWHFDDKVAQHYVLASHGIPTPRTWVWYERGAALDWARHARYPLVLKLRSGAGSSNVRLVRSYGQAARWIRRLFGRGVKVLDQVDHRTRDVIRVTRTMVRQWVRRSQPGYTSTHLWELHKDYVLFQEFLPGNAFDTRITVIGDRAFGFRRFNRPGDFRASGSGRLDANPGAVAPEFVSLAFDAARRLGVQSCAIDGLWRGDTPVIGEMSYTYVSSSVAACPGHWTPELTWKPGPMWPEQAQAADFLAALLARRDARAALVATA